MDILSAILEQVPPLLFAMAFHEAAHGLIAWKLGDPTAKLSGRISLNPLVHIDWIWTVFMPAMLLYAGSPIVFGAAKPVPVDPRYFKNPRKGMMWVALAGPVSNFILAAIAYSLLLLASTFDSIPQNFAFELIIKWLFYGVLINLIFGLFNLIPVPPLDGGRIMVGILPLPLARMLARLEPYGFIIVIFLVYLRIPNMIIDPIIDKIFAGILPAR